MGLLLAAGACTGSASTPSNPSVPTTAAEVQVSPTAPPVAIPNADPVQTPVATAPVVPTPKPAPYDPTGLPYGINSSQTPYPFVLSNFNINPQGLRLFLSTNVSVVVTNNSTLPASYAVTLGVRTASGGSRATIIPSNTQVVNLAGGESTTVSFTLSGLGNGTHIVYIDQFWDRVSVDSQV